MSSRASNATLPSTTIAALTGFLLLVGASTIPAAATHSPYTCRWDGTAPFCSGACRRNEERIGRSVRGDGAKCATGHKEHCCRRVSSTCTTLRVTNVTTPSTNRQCPAGFGLMEVHATTTENVWSIRCCHLVL
jgi:hypothetical protein